MFPRFFQPQIQVLFCEYEELSSWNHPDLRSPFWRLYRTERAAPKAGHADRCWPREEEVIAHLAGTLPSPAGAPYLPWSLPLRHGHIVLIPPETSFHSSAPAPIRQFYLHFQALPPFDRLSAPWIEVPPGSTQALTLHTSIDAAASLVKEHGHGSHAMARRGEAQVPLTLSLACHALALAALRSVPPMLLERPVLDERVAGALEYLRANLHRVVPVAELAGRVPMNPNAFNALFRRHTGYPVAHWHLAERVSRACVLLKFSSQGIAEIAQATGFVDRYHFTHAFTRLRGRSPARYRREVT